MATLEDLEARVAALEASQADYHALGLTTVRKELGEARKELDDFRHETRAASRSVDEQLAEIKDLIVGRRDG